MEGALIFYFGMDYIKGTLFDDKGVETITIERPLDILINEEYVEQSPAQWFDVMIRIIGIVQQERPDICIDSISLSYQPGTFVCIDRSGNNIENALLPSDRRSIYQAQICDKMFKKYNDSIGIPWNCMVYPRLMWIKYNKPDVYKKIYKVLTPDGYIAYKLCGETAIDSYSAAFLGYNIKHGEYNRRIISNSELEYSTFPDVCRIGDCIGVISGNMKEELGFKADVKFIMASNCLIPMAQITGMGEKHSIVFDAETSNISFIRDQRRIKRNRGLIRLPFDNERDIYGFIGDYEMQFLKWIRNLTDNIKEDHVKYTPGSNGLILLPQIMGDGICNNADIRASIIGINNDTSLSNIITSYFEAAGYILKDRIERITDSSIKVDSIEIISNIKDELFYHIISDITGRKVIINNKDNNIIKYTYHSVTDRIHEEVTEKQEIMPDEANYNIYRQFFSLYTNAYHSFNDMLKYRRRVLQKITL